MAISKYRRKVMEDLAKKAYALYKQGLTLREVAESPTIQMSHEWVRKAIKKLSGANDIDGY